jgi:hypothetical protein
MKVVTQSFTYKDQRITVQVSNVASFNKTTLSTDRSKFHVVYKDGSYNDIEGPHDFVEILEMLLQACSSVQLVAYEEGLKKGERDGYDRGYVEAAEKYMDF